MSHPYYKSEQWLALRKIILNRDSWTCRRCNKNRATEVHHLHYENWMDEKPSDLISICRDCHQQEHTYPELDDWNTETWWKETKAISWEKIMND